jgi:hypothetical protein
LLELGVDRLLELSVDRLLELGVDRLLELGVDRLCGNDAYIVLLDDNVALAALHVGLEVRPVVAAVVHDVSDQSANEEGPLNGAKRSSGFGGIPLGNKAVNVAACGRIGVPSVAVRLEVCIKSIQGVPYSCYVRERCKGREPKNDG